VLRDPPDLILLDVMMPGMNGFDVCTQLRSDVRTTFIPVLMLTALQDPDSRARAFVVGTDDFVSKPYSRAELLARVRRILQRTYGLQPDQEVAGNGSSEAAFVPFAAPID
jgi:DNA-binding response OmpR family regulator